MKINKMKIMTVVGTRPEVIRLSRVISAFDKYCDHIIVHTGQNYDYELNQIFFNDLGVRKPDYFLNVAGGSGPQTIGNVIISIDKLLDNTFPDALLVLGDTNSCMAVIPAKRRKIPIFHMEAGNRCFDMRVPEEINRRIVDHTADINLTYSSIARDYLLSEGLAPDRVIKTGSPMFEVLNFYMDEINSSNILEDLSLDKGKFFLISAHREENIDSNINLLKLKKILDELSNRFGYPVVVSTHPRTRKRFEEHNIVFNPLVRLLKPLGFHDYNKLQISAKAVLSDSGTISEESSIMNFPALNLREVHERPEAFEEASVMMVGLEMERVMQGLEVLSDQPYGERRLLRPVPDYSVPNVSEKVVRIVLSYRDYVMKEVWKQY